jgi:hypothetical protein
MMPKPVDEIVATQKAREFAMGAPFAEMREVLAAVGGKLVVPLPELDRNERSSVPNLILQGSEAKAQRIASVVPTCEYPVLRPGIKLWEDKARTQKRANLAWWEQSQIEIVLAQRARHLICYTTSPVKVTPNFKLGIPKWSVPEPLGTFPPPGAGALDMMPSDIIYTYASTVNTLRRDYPIAMGWFRGGTGDEKCTLIEYCDEYERVMLATGTSDSRLDPSYAAPVAPIIRPMGDYGRSYEWIAELDRRPNLAGVTWAVVVGTIGLQKPVNRYAQMIGTHLAAAKMQALEMVGVQGGVLPKWYFVQTEQQGGIIAQATVGQLGHVKGGRLEKVDAEPSLRPDAALDRYERAMRIDGGVPVSLGGEHEPGVRTGRLGAQLLSAAIDPDVAECQRLLQRSMAYEDEIAVAQVKAYAPNRPVSFYVNWKGATGPVNYKAAELFDAHAPSIVSYPMVGADEQEMLVGVGQRLGLGILSKYEAMTYDPLVRDREVTHDRIVYEGLETAVIQGMQQRAAADPAFVSSVVRIMQAVLADKVELADAYMAEEKRVQEQQASSGAPGEPTGPVNPNAPEAQPGLGVPGGSAMVGTAIQPPGPSSDNLISLLRQARTVTQAARAG